MKRILLACSAGMSTSLLVANMQKYAQSIGIEVMIKAVPVAQAETKYKEWDIVMLGPQVRHTLKRFEEIIDGQIPVTVIDMRDYGMMHGENVLKKALAILGE